MLQRNEGESHGRSAEPGSYAYVAKGQNGTDGLGGGGGGETGSPVNGKGGKGVVIVRYL